MGDMKTTYLGIELKNPLLVGSSGFTGNIKDIIDIEKKGAGGVVLKSLFEEEIIAEARTMSASSSGTSYGNEAEAYLNYYVEQNNVENYLNLIRESKKETSLPVIASVNCITSKEWTTFASKIQDAGADALELNVFIMPSDPKIGSAELEKKYFDIVANVKKNISIPLCLKLSPYFTALAKTYIDLSEAVNGLVLFNRFFNPDIDIHKKEIISASVYSTSAEISLALRWTAILSGKVKSDIAISSGVHDGDNFIKALLAGAQAVYVVSALYNEGTEVINKILKDANTWMDNNNYETIKEFTGLLSQRNISDPEIYERSQFMKYYSSHSK